MSDTKIKIVKNKLISLYDGNIENARHLSMDELLDHIAFRLNSISHGIKTQREPSSSQRETVRH